MAEEDISCYDQKIYIFLQMVEKNPYIFNQFRAAMLMSFYTGTKTAAWLYRLFFHPQPVYLSISVSFFICAYVSKHTTYVYTPLSGYLSP